MSKSVTPMGAVAKGAAAGIAGTAAMDLVWFARYKKSGGEDGFVDWEFSSGLKDWDAAPAPAQVGKRLVEGLFGRELPPEAAAFTNNATHWATGLMWGVFSGWPPVRLPRPRSATGWPWDQWRGSQVTSCSLWPRYTGPFGSTTPRR